jgi:DNA polymerase III alpha chain
MNIDDFDDSFLSGSERERASSWPRKSPSRWEQASIEEIPCDLEGMEFFMKDGIEVSGTAFSDEERRVGSRTKHVILITDGKDSLPIVIFASERNPIRIPSPGDRVVARGRVAYDRFIGECVLNASSIESKPSENRAEAPNMFRPRPELHVRTNFSAMDGISDVSEYISHAKELGIGTIAFADADNVQCMPDIAHAADAAAKAGVKLIPGCELGVKPSWIRKSVLCGKDRQFAFWKSPSVVAIDIETTGLSKMYDDIIQVSAVRHSEDGAESSYSTFVKADCSKMSEKSRELTHITDDQIMSGKDPKEMLRELMEFVGDSLVIAHNATFDVGFLSLKAKELLGIEWHPDYADTMLMAKAALGGTMKRFGLAPVSKKLGVALEAHHSAIDDALCCLGIFEELLKRAIRKDLKLGEALPARASATAEAKSAKAKESLSAALTAAGIAFSWKDIPVEKGMKAECSFEAAPENSASLAEAVKASKCRATSCHYDTPARLSSFDAMLPADEADPRDLVRVTALVMKQEGLKNLFRLVSYANDEGLQSNGAAVLSWDRIAEDASGLAFGSSGMRGLLGTLFYEGRDAFERELDAGRYSFVEIAPNCDETIRDSDYADACRTLMAEAKKRGIPTIAVSDCSYCLPSEKEAHDVLVSSPGLGGIMHPLFGRKLRAQGMLSNTEMPELLKKQGIATDRESLKELIYDNPQRIADAAEPVKILKDGLNTPTDDFLAAKGVPSVKADLQRIVLENANSKYACKGRLPDLIQKRLDKELASIIGHGFAIVYYIAYMLVRRSNADGYIVGSRGSVGSSFVAYLMGITEVNPLPPHYWCPKCHRTFFRGDDAGLDRLLSAAEDGFDLAPASCPNDGTPLERDGHDIPFETFLGFNGDKVPDIDLNFSGDYQSRAHDFCKEMFGADHAFRAGTISTIADKTAFALVRSHYEGLGEKLRPCETARRAMKLLGTKRTTGQHPGGIIVIPNGFDVLDFTPTQHPAGDKGSAWLTTHFDFHAIHDNVLKLDILGHDDPTVLKYLQDYVAAHPQKFPFASVKDIPLGDPKVTGLLAEDRNGCISSDGIPEFNTPFVTGMLRETKPHTFAELVKVSGLSHGTDVWKNNGEDLVTGKHGPKAAFGDIIGCRDDIMLRLIGFGMQPKDAFSAMEFVRKGKPSKDKEGWKALKEKMESAGVPEQFIWSCERIHYLFPKAHACAYVISAMRIAWFKAYHPALFYASWLGIRGGGSTEIETILGGREAMDERIAEIEGNQKSTDTEKDVETALKVAERCTEAGIVILPPDINASEARDFAVSDDEGKIRASLGCVSGIGPSMAAEIVEERKRNGPYRDLEDMASRTGATKAAVKALQRLSAA